MVLFQARLCSGFSLGETPSHLIKTNCIPFCPADPCWWMITIMPRSAAWLVLLIKFTSHCDTEFSRKHLGLNSNNALDFRLSWSTLVSWNHQLVFTTRISPGLSTTWEVGWLNSIYLYFSKFLFLNPPPYNFRQHVTVSNCLKLNFQTLSPLLSTQILHTKISWS